MLIVVTFPSPTTGEESALDGAKQAAPPGVVLVDAGASRRDEEAVGSISQDAFLALFSLFHLALQTFFSMRFLVVFAVSLAAFFGHMVLSATQDLHPVLVVALMLMAEQADASCSRSAAPRCRLVG